MNEKIQELAAQAENYANTRAWDGEFHSAYTQKLVELVVKECADLFEVEYGQSGVSGNLVARVLKQHFGVQA